MTHLRFAVADAVVIAERGLKRIRRNPDLATAFTVQPIMFVLLFVYVFGGAIEVPSQFGDYADFLMPGIIVQWMAFGGFATALGLAEDMNRGLIDRFRSLPMARSAVLTGRTFADIVTNSLGLTVMLGVGLIVGFSFGASPPEVVAGIGLMLLIGYAFSWVFAWIGLIVSSPESANAYGFIIIFPLTFLSSAFVPPDTLPPYAFRGPGLSGVRSSFSQMFSTVALSKMHVFAASSEVTHRRCTVAPGDLPSREY